MTAALAAAGDRRDAGSSRRSTRSGLDGLRYLVVERKVVAAESQTQAVLAFAGARRGIASWLAAPAPMGALDFVSPHAQVAAAFVFKSPSLVFDDLSAWSATSDPRPRDELAQLESKLDLRLREDLAETLGGEFALALDGPLLPTPAWKLVVEVYDPARLQASLELLVLARQRRSRCAPGAAGLRLEAEQVGERDVSFPARRRCRSSCTTRSPTATWSPAPSRALVMQAIRTRESGETLARSAALPRALPARPRRARLRARLPEPGPDGRLAAAGARRQPAQRRAAAARSRP